MRRYGLVDIPDQASDIDAVPITRTITINGVTYDLSANRTWTTTSNNIYNTDGTLTSNRTLTHSTYSLTFAGTTSTRFHSNGNISVGTTTDTGAKLNVLGQATFGDFITQFTGVIAYSAAVTQTRLGIFNGRIWATNAADVSLFIDVGGTGVVGNQPVRIYTEEYSGGAGIKFPLCLQGNGYETIFGQNTITTNASSLVTMVSTTKGFLPPRMTSAQRTAIASPATGLIVYQTDGSAGLYVRNAAAWQLLGSGTGTVTSVSVVSANGFAGTVANATTTPAITLSTTITGMLKGNGTAISAAVDGTDYVSSNIYTANGTISSTTRIVDLNSNKLWFNNGYSYSQKGVISAYQFIASINAASLNNQTTQQSYFINTGGSSLTCIANTTYFFETLIYITGMSSTSGNLTFDIKGSSGTATITSTLYSSYGLDATTPTTAAAISGAIHSTVTSNVPVTAGTGTAIFVKISGIFRVSTGGIIIPSIALANGVSTAQVEPNTFFRMFPVGSNGATYFDGI